ncbi:lanosterol 14-alpha-demethylase [Aulographum hederae CBS 113979]|uniref:Lanosterol 14-alpha-demethylase n=1 Tax=Aulographum hederae CBS 113979 TaxID=1176131 RepID=A0A6G1GN63_9PEZI|nr:lanosterol 14-alpha-demethylase [Aulographum hederae CBS 113979]
MAPTHEKSQLKRALGSVEESTIDSKKPRRSQRILSNSTDDDPATPLKQSQLPSPLTHKDSTATEATRSGTTTPPNAVNSQPPAMLSPPRGGLTSPPTDTQPYSQFVYPPKAFSYEVEDEVAEGVWGYLVPLDSRGGEPLILRRRAACPVPESKVGRKDGRTRVGRKEHLKQEENYEKEKMKYGIVAGGYLIGRHPECDRIIDNPTVSNRHCLLFSENKTGQTVAVLEDVSGNGTFVNEALVGRNKRRVLEDGDEVAILNEARFIFRYPHDREKNAFRQQYKISEQLGKGHFASVYLCIEKNSGMKYAVKKFEKRPGPGEKSRVEGLQQEVAVLMSVSHPALLCLKDTFDEEDGVYLVLELAPEGELFNWIVMKQKLTEADARKVFVQLFQALKYLHERNIVHRDIKPENILLVDKQLNVKLADFGLAKIIGEESFTTTLCGTPSYVAPEILKSSNHRRYTRAVDVWSLGVVLYICLCGFPPFSDELYSPDNPYTLAEQILNGRFDYPSPYWDSVGDPALDLIDRMLTVDVDKRITIDECLEHPWTTAQTFNPNDSTDGLTGAIAQLDFSRRKVQRERTLLSAINDVKLSRVIEIPNDLPSVKVYEKNAGHASQMASKSVKSHVLKEADPASKRDTKAFMDVGGKGDPPLFGDDSGSPFAEQIANSSTSVLVCAAVASFVTLAVVANVLAQLLFKNPHEPPLVFHWVPFFGSTITYGIDPYRFFFGCREKYGDVFTFVLLGKKTTVCLGTHGNEFILNGKHKDLNAEEIYGPLTTPVFGKDVVYDCPNSKLMEQKKFVKFGLTSEALRSYVQLITEEVQDYIKKSPHFKGQKGTLDVPPAMAELTIYTASRSLQGKEVREKMNHSFSDLYHDLDMGFTPINFMLPWAPLPQNRKRDAAREKMVEVYMGIINSRKAGGEKQDSEDMIWNLMGSKYKDGTTIPDQEVAHMMIALLMAGQHSSSATISWALLNLASRPELVEELLQEQKDKLGTDLPPLTLEAVQSLPLNAQVIKETLRIHTPIHSIMRKVTSPIPVSGTPYVIPPGRTLLASPGVTARDSEHFPNPLVWDPHRWDESNATTKPTEEDDDDKVDYGYGLVSKGAGSPYLPFGAGRHRCIGEQFAYVQLGTILANLVREFKMCSPTGSREVVGTDYSSLFSRPLNPAVVQWEKREGRE